MKPFRCQICGETYLGESRPDRCPYCGAPEQNLKSAAEWINYGVIAMTPQSKDFCMHALDFEVSNSAFYKMCALKAETQINAAIFGRLHQQEGQHAQLISKMLGIPSPPEKLGDVPAKDAEKFMLAHDRELRVQQHYQQILSQSPELRLKEVFAALLDAEGEHLKIANIYG